MSEYKDTRIKQLEAENEDLERDRDEWKESTIAANKRFQMAEDRERALKQRCEELESWKAEANTIFNALDLQAIGKEINAPLGQDIAPHVLPAIRELKARNKRIEDCLVHERTRVADLIDAKEGLERKLAEQQAAYCRLHTTAKEQGVVFTFFQKQEELTALLAKAREEGANAAYLDLEEAELTKAFREGKEEGRREAVRIPELLFEAWDYGQFSDDFDYSLAKPIRAAIREMLSTAPKPQPMISKDVNVSKWYGFYISDEGALQDVLDNFWRLTCPCGLTATYGINALPTQDTPHPCGNPDHMTMKIGE